MSEAKQIIPMQVWAILDPERYIKKSIKDWSLAIYDERESAVRQIESISRANCEECFIEELAICNKVKLDDYITAHNEMYEMLESARNELYQLIDEVNDQRASNITSQTESEPDYYDQETIYLIDKLLAKARGEQ